MLHGVGMIAGQAVGQCGGRCGSPPDIRPDIPNVADRRLDHLRNGVESGRIDTEKLEERLKLRFGDAADGIVSDDGTVDFDRLKSLIIEHRVSALRGGLDKRFGEDAREIVADDGTVDIERLRALVKQRRAERTGEGDRPHGGCGVGGDGDDSVDTDALRRRLSDIRPDTPYDGAGHRRRFHAGLDHARPLIRVRA